jgi:hypothetical protein
LFLLLSLFLSSFFSDLSLLLFLFLFLFLFECWLKGNEPDIDAPWQFAVANRSDLTAEHVHWVAKHRYSLRPDGIPGNDDYGAISGWLVWAYLVSNLLLTNG